MKRRRSLLFLIAAAAGLAAIHRWAPRGQYTFGHAEAVDLAEAALLWLLFGTHVIFASLMFIQGATWNDAEERTFRFVGVKGIFWGFFAATATLNPGVDLAGAYLFALMMLTTLDVDVAIVRRYVIHRPR